jgi:hypothetical protein
MLAHSRKALTASAKTQLAVKKKFNEQDKDTARTILGAIEEPTLDPEILDVVSSNANGSQSRAAFFLSTLTQWCRQDQIPEKSKELGARTFQGRFQTDASYLGIFESTSECEPENATNPGNNSDLTGTSAENDLMTVIESFEGTPEFVEKINSFLHLRYGHFPSQGDKDWSDVDLTYLEEDIDILQDFDDLILVNWRNVLLPPARELQNEY